MTDETAFGPSRCPKCSALTLVGVADGLRWRLAACMVPVDDARILARYGTTVLALDVRAGAVWGQYWHPYGEPRPGQYLATAHVCGSTHEQREENS